MIDRIRHGSALDGPNWQFTLRSLAKILALYLPFSSLAVVLSENALGRTIGRTAQQPAQAPRVVGAKADDEKEARLLEPGKPIKRELAGDHSHTYEVRLSAGQFLKVIVEQQGIDVVAQVSGPSGEQIAEFDMESRSQGQELAPLVAEAEGKYRLNVRPRQKQASAGGYEIRIEELRAATEDDRALHEALTLLQGGLKLQRAGKYGEALPLIDRSREIRERVLGPEHRDVAVTLNSLATLYYFNGEYAKAESLWQRALAILEKTLGPENPKVAAALGNLGQLYKDRGDYEKAELLQQRTLAIFEKALGPESPEVAQALNNLASFYTLNRGDYARAEPMLKHALAIREKVFGPESLPVAGVLDHLGNLYRARSEYEKAEPVQLRALDIFEKTLGPKHREVAAALGNLGILYHARGDYKKAEPLQRRALAIFEEALGPEGPEIALMLSTLGSLHLAKGDYAKAEPLFQRALTIREKGLGPEHPDVAESLNDLATFYEYSGQDLKVEPLIQRALAIFEKTSGPKHPNVAQALYNLANLYRDRGDLAQSELTYRRAQAIYEQVFGPQISNVADCLNGLAILYLKKGDLAQAIAAQSQAGAIVEHNLALTLAIGSERQKLAYLTLFSKQTDFTLSLHSQALPHDPQALDLAFTTLLRRKGRGLDVMAGTIAALRRRAAPEVQALFDQLSEARSQLAALTLKGSGADKPETYRARLRPLEDRADDLESALIARNPDIRAQAQPVTLAAVQAALPAGGALVEFAVYTPQDPRNNKNKLPPRYLAYLLEAQGRPKWTDLGEAAPIDRAINAWRQALRDPRRTDVNRLARVVDEKVMRPVLALAQSELGATRRLLIAPDGLLNLVPFAALVDRHGRYLVERYSISYLTGGRDLLRSPVRRPGGQEAVIVADPDYGARAGAVVAMNRDVGLPSGLPQFAGSRLNLDEIYFPPLKGTAGEARALKAILPQATVFTRERATEAALKQLHSPSILHVATHGFFLRDQELELVGGRDAGAPTVRSVGPSDQRVENPLLRSGLALAGVNQRIGRADQRDDGVLTALEAAGLDLFGTKLVVLSACDTGVGRVKNGEGVFGLRRALALAGSETQVMSLWPVSDLGARDLMIEYYKSLERGEGRGDGMRRVQLEMLKREGRRHPFYWASFIQSGEWANLEGKR
jgi:CHAT domain-containing protein/Flp pilus assembly protein TadD